MDLHRAFRENLRAAVRQVVPVHTSDDDVLQPHKLHRLGQTHRLLGVILDGRSMSDGAVRTVARANVSQHHERRRTVLPALPDVGATCLLAHGVKPETPHQPSDLGVVAPTGRTNLQPAWLSVHPTLQGRKGVPLSDLHQVHNLRNIASTQDSGHGIVWW